MIVILTVSRCLCVDNVSGRKAEDHALHDGGVSGAVTLVSRCLASNHRHLSYHTAARPGTFQARDNISQFIGWCRSTLAVPDTLLFETEDLVSRRNERNVLLCLLEVYNSQYQ